MLYIVRAYDTYSDMYEYEYGYLNHAEEHFEREENADIIEYDQGKETILRRKMCGKEITTQN